MRLEIAPLSAKSSIGGPVPAAGNFRLFRPQERAIFGGSET
jgi:hypothetical protein